MTGTEDWHQLLAAKQLNLNTFEILGWTHIGQRLEYIDSAYDYPSGPFSLTKFLSPEVANCLSSADHVLLLML